jgi:hypothetical protein
MREDIAASVESFDKWTNNQKYSTAKPPSFENFHSDG